MSTDVVIPKMGMTMSEGTLHEWLVADGAEVKEGEPLYVIVTEKIEAEVEAEAAGILEQLVEPGTTLPVGGLLGRLLGPDDDTPQAAAATPSPLQAASSNGSGRILASPNARRIAREHGVDLTATRGTGPAGRIVSEDIEDLMASRPAQPTARPAAAPAASFAARQLADKLGVDLATVMPTATDGKLTKRDVEAAAAARLKSVPSELGVRSGALAPLATPSSSVPPPDRIPLTGMRGVIARRMHESLQQMAQLTLGMEAPADALVCLRDELKEAWPIDGKVVPTYTDLVARAAALALRSHPLVNARLVTDAVELLADVHVGVAVAVDGGLVVPVVRDADRIGLSQFAAESRRLVDCARANELTLDDMEGATFSVTALGSYGIDFFTPVINPPNVAILGVGRIRDTAIWDHDGDDHPRRARILTLSLTFDHRAIDGAPAAAFLQSVAGFLERPLRLL